MSRYAKNRVLPGFLAQRWEAGLRAPFSRSVRIGATAQVMSSTVTSVILSTPIEQGASVVVRLEAELQAVAQAYAIRSSDVVQFLRRNPYLIELILEARAWIAVAFGTSPVALELMSDPESDHRMLQAFVTTRRTPEEAGDALEWLDSAWWLSAARASEGKFQINVEIHE